MKHKLCDNKYLYVVENHQEVLPIWSEYYFSRNCASHLELVSLDYHADTLSGFKKYSFDKMLESGNRNLVERAVKFREEFIQKMMSDLSQKTIEDNYDKLNCDEHIMTACELGIISRYQVIYCLEDYDEFCGLHLQFPNNYCNRLYEPTVNCFPRRPEDEIRKCHSRLEDFYLKESGLVVPKKDFILDIDLDYFQSANSFRPLSYEFMKSLIQKCELITIARSTSYFENLKIEKDLDIDIVESEVIDFIRRCL